MYNYFMLVGKVCHQYNDMLILEVNGQKFKIYLTFDIKTKLKGIVYVKGIIHNNDNIELIAERVGMIGGEE